MPEYCLLLPKHWCQVTTHHSQWVWSKNTNWGQLPWVFAWPFTCIGVWTWSSPLTSVFSSGKWAPWWLFHLLGCMCACWEQEALRGLSGFLSLEQIWTILPPREKGIFCLEVIADIPKAKYWFKPNDLYFWTMTQKSDWVDASVLWAPTRPNDYWLRLFPYSLTCQPFLAMYFYLK